MDTDSDNVLVRFVPKPGSPSNLRVPDSAIAVPVTTKRAGLADVVNSLMKLDPPRKFRFFVDGEAVKGTLSAISKRMGISGEAVLGIEYVEVESRPAPEAVCEHDDWVSGVAVDEDGYAMTAAYNGVTTLWDLDLGTVGGDPERTRTRTRLGTSVVGGLPIKACIWLPKTAGNVDYQGRRYAVSASKDHKLTSYLVSRDERVIDTFRTYDAHTDSVECVAAAPSGTRFASGSWDTTVNVWHLRREADSGGDGDGDGDGEDGSAKKKRRKGKGKGRGKDDSSVPSVERAPIVTLRGHSQCVSGIKWEGGDGGVWSGSWDHTLRRWDVESGQAVALLASSKAASVVACLSLSGRSSSLVSGHADRVVRVWDARASDTLVQGEFRGHEGWVTAVEHCPSPGREHLVASLGHDGTVCVWDLRGGVDSSASASAKPVFKAAVHSDKGLCLAWCRCGGEGEGDVRWCVATGGADKQMVVTRVPI